MRLLNVLIILFFLPLFALADEEVCTRENVDASLEAIEACVNNNDANCAILFARNNPILNCITYQAGCTRIISRKDRYGHQGTSRVIFFACKPVPPSLPSSPENRPTPPERPAPPYRPYRPTPRPGTASSCHLHPVLQCEEDPNCEVISGKAGLGGTSYRCCPKGGSFYSCGPNQ